MVVNVGRMVIFEHTRHTGSHCLLCILNQVVAQLCTYGKVQRDILFFQDASILSGHYPCVLAMFAHKFPQ